ncbi:DUF6484 domain-containing protein [Paraliomyxa miuraensis]|uniref:DUF6484 domain-containing protein n=1 Tax=Paraliomyxa miuraensis TaxID=376150 RepID=UPI00224E9FC7|nr:DUF6484 domain-containing protein [Paraliomyxa miuraensis]MCX4240948.1 DUF6484 domain-containing protein [Paraliomyxa miuraensis]
MSHETKPKESADVVELPVELGPITAPRTGRLVGHNEQGRLLVDFPGNPFGPLRARTTVVLAPDDLQRAVQEQRAVLLLFEEGDPGRPIVVGLLQDVATSAPPPLPVEVQADGRRVEVEAADELVLRCGDASLVLRRNGRVIIRGTYVETRSQGVNRIKGGSVLIN